MKKFNSIIIILALAFLFIFSPLFVKAAMLRPILQNKEYEVGDIFVVELVLDSQGKYINTVEGGISFNPEVLRVEDISQGSSVLTLWIKEPSFSNESGVALFTGGTPNGFEGKIGSLVKIIFKAISQGESKIAFLDSSRTLLNDGFGTEASLVLTEEVVKIKSVSKLNEPIKNEWIQNIENDLISPESFKVYFNREEIMFAGQYYVIFSTTDKQTGIAHYEIKEGEEPWQKATSPYVLKDQSLSAIIRVKAIDKAGNERIEIVHPSLYLGVAKVKLKTKIFAIGLILVVILLALWYVFIKVIFRGKDNTT